MIQPSLAVVVMLEVVTARCMSRCPSGRHGEMRGLGGGVDDGSRRVFLPLLRIH
jgi:hypothetical protein